MTTFKRGDIMFKRRPTKKEGLYVIEPMPEKAYHHTPVFFSVGEIMNQLTYVRMVFEEMISVFPNVKAEGIIHPQLLAILETQLIQADMLTHDNLVGEKNSEVLRISFRYLGKEVFETEKMATFSKPKDSKRSRFHHGTWHEVDGELCMEVPVYSDVNTYLVGKFPECQTHTDYFNQLFTFLNDAELKNSDEGCSYEDMINHMTTFKVHEDVLFYIRMTISNMLWLHNSTSWRANELYIFDRMDIERKFL